MLPLGEGLALLGELGIPAPVRADVGARLAPAETLYGLGFTTSRGALRVKAYVLDDVAGRVGFRSVRATADGVEADERRYEAEADAARAGLDCARRAARAPHVSVLGHVARSPGRGAKVYVDASGKPTRVVPEGRQAGSSFSNCVVKLIRQTRFKKARKDSVHSATFKL